MTTSLTKQRDLLYVADISDVGDLIAELDAVRGRLEGQGSGAVWSFQTEISKAVEFSLGFCFGVRGEVGALLWDDGERGWLPADGVNTDWVDYFTGGYSHHFPMRPGAEVPIDVVYAALREFVATGERPTCVNWRQAPEL